MLIPRFFLLKDVLALLGALYFLWSLETSYLTNRRLLQFLLGLCSIIHHYEKTYILSILSLLTTEHGIALHLFRSLVSQQCFIVVRAKDIHIFYHISLIHISFDLIVHGRFTISFSIYCYVTDFYKLIFYPTTLLNSLTGINSN